MFARSAAPWSVRVAGGLVGLQCLAGVAFAVAVLARSLGASAPLSGDDYGEAGYFALLSCCVAVVAGGLLLGRRWSRTPATVLQLLLLGVMWYVIGPSRQFAIGAVIAALCVAVLALLFTRPGRAWAVGASTQAHDKAD